MRPPGVRASKNRYKATREVVAVGGAAAAAVGRANKGVASLDDMMMIVL